MRCGSRLFLLTVYISSMTDIVLFITIYDKGIVWLVYTVLVYCIDTHLDIIHYIIV